MLFTLVVPEFMLFQSLKKKNDFMVKCYWYTFPFVPQQAQKIDASLLKFPEQLGHIGDAARYEKAF